MEQAGFAASPAFGLPGRGGLCARLRGARRMLVVPRHSLGDLIIGR
jgi:hypothetical protein